MSFAQLEENLARQNSDPDKTSFGAFARRRRWVRRSLRVAADAVNAGDIGAFGGVQEHENSSQAAEDSTPFTAIGDSEL